MKGTNDTSTRRVGLLLFLTAAASVVMVFARVSADADQPTLLESLRTIAENSAMYTTSAVARIVSGITLLLAGLLLLRTQIIRGGFASPLFLYLLTLSGSVTAVSGLCAIVLAISSPNLEVPISSSIESINMLRWFTGKTGFALAGLALLVAAHSQWKIGGTLRKAAPATALVGLVMQFIWIDAATIVHPIMGVVFMAWIVAFGAILAFGRTEQFLRKIP